MAGEGSRYVGFNQVESVCAGHTEAINHFWKGKRMKKLLIITIMLGMASMANAGMYISVNGVVDPPDTQFILCPSDTMVVDIYADTEMDQGAYCLGISRDSTGTGELNIDSAVVLYPGIPSWVEWQDDADIAEILGIESPFVWMTFMDVFKPTDPVIGTLVDEIIFHCTGIGDVTLVLFDDDGNILDN